MPAVVRRDARVIEAYLGKSAAVAEIVANTLSGGENTEQEASE
ncbi:MAG: hypothetical protein ACRDHZ_23740 [Ktedonobacteraceae bacterium]